MSECNHATCHKCHKLVEPIKIFGKLCVTTYCPHCGAVLSKMERGEQRHE